MNCLIKSQLAPPFLVPVYWHHHIARGEQERRFMVLLASCGSILFVVMVSSPATFSEAMDHRLQRVSHVLRFHYVVDVVPFHLSDRPTLLRSPVQVLFTTTTTGMSIPVSIFLTRRCIGDVISGLFGRTLGKLAGYWMDASFTSSLRKSLESCGKVLFTRR